MTRQRVTVKEAAERLGITVEAVRKRIERDQLDYERADSRVYVYLDEDRTESGPDVEVESNALISEMRDRIGFLERELERKDAILLNMTEAMKALNPPPGPRESPETASEGEGKGPVREKPTEERKGFWARLFGG